MVSRTVGVFAFVTAALGCFTAYAAELDPRVIVITAPDQFKWRDPTDQASTNQVILQGDPNKEGSLYINNAIAHVQRGGKILLDVAESST